MQRATTRASHLHLLCFVILTCVLTAPAYAQKRKQADAIGDPLDGLKPIETTFFNHGRDQFLRVWGMSEGVGPVFTDGACGRCHSLPVLGGSSNRLLTFFGKTVNGVFDPLDGNGPSGENEGGILLQPRSNQAFLRDCSQGGEVPPQDANKFENRSAPPVFGFGLIDAIADIDIQNEAVDKGMGVKGRPNVGDVFLQDFPPPHTVGRFGRKAQIANLVEMAAFAFAHDLGITNELNLDEDLPQGQPIDLNCTLNTARPNNPNEGSGGNGMFPLSHFARYLAPPKPLSCDDNTPCSRGKQTFSNIGCDLCHKQSYTTPSNVQVRTDLSGTSLTSPALSNQTVTLYSDLLLHDLGNADKGSIPEGQMNTSLAKLTEWRTTPLWGLQYRLADPHLMHGGAARSLDSAIKLHSDGISGEGTVVIGNYLGLSPQDQADLWAFLATL